MPRRPADIGRSLLLAAALVGSSLAVAAPAHAAAGPEYFGTNLQTLGAIAPANQGAVLDQLAAGKLTLNRFEVSWRNMEPAAPRNGVASINWGATDSVITLMARHGLRAAPIFRFAPNWAKGNTAELSSTYFPDFAEFIKQFAMRYKPGGTFWTDPTLFAKTNPGVAPQPTTSYEIWNEVNLDKYAWNNKADPAALASLLQTIRPVLKAVQPDAVLLTDLAWQNTPTDAAADPAAGLYVNYVAAFAAAGGLAALDAMGYHPYAPDADSILTLIRRLRSQLDAAGYPNLPIYANESGLPVTYTGPGTQFGANVKLDDPSTFPSDGARASSLEFAGDALASSDCGVDQFLPYSVSGSETTAEGQNEGWMGMFRPGTGAATLTSQALQRASLAWTARFSPGGSGAPAPLAICRGGASPDASLLPIQANFTGANGGCVDMVDAYNGNPMESAILTLVRASDGATLATARSDAYGRARACVPDLNADVPFRAYATVPQAGISGTALCDVPGAGCPAGTTLTPTGRSTISARAAIGYVDPPAKPAVTPEQKTAAIVKTKAQILQSCKWSATASMLKRTLKGSTTKSRLTVKALTKCAVAPSGTTVRFIVAVKRKGSKKEAKIRSLFLTTGVARSVNLAGKFASGDLIVLSHAAEPLRGVPKIRATVSVGAKLVRK